MKQKNRYNGLRRWAAGAAAVILTGMCVGMTSGPVWAEDSSEDSTSTFDDGTLTYTILSGTEVSITACSTSATHVSIMSEIDGYNIVSIGEEAFAECTSLQALSIPSSVTEIGDAAFYGCTSLTLLTIPNSVTEIPAGCFFECTALEELNLGEATVSIGDMAFGYCTALEELTLPDTVESIGDQLFYYCTALQTVSIPDQLTELGSYTFYGCMSMQEFVIPAMLEDIGAMTFFGCQSLKSISVEEGNPTYTVEDNVLYNTDQTILYLYPAGRTDASFAVPDDVLVIYAGAFFSAYNLEQVTFGSGLQYIGEMAFDFCISLQSLTIPETVTTIGTTAFSDCTALTSVTFEGADDEDGGEGDALEIGDYAFFCCDSLLNVRLPKRVSEIGLYAFGCTSPEEEGNDTITITTDSGESILIDAIDGFLLTGYTGVASNYAKDCDVKVKFQSIDFDWATFALYVGIALVVVVVILIAIRIVRHNMMTAAEKAALHGTAEQTEDAEETDDGYRSIVDDDVEEAEADDRAPMSYEQMLSHSSLHQIGHADPEEEDAEEADEEEES